MRIMRLTRKLLKRCNQSVDQRRCIRRRQTSLWGVVVAIARAEEGSAVLEFVAIAIPLFVPLILYFGTMNAKVQEAFDLNNLARQAARAYITAPDESLAEARVQAVLDVASHQHSLDLTNQSISYQVECSAQPCLTPDSHIKVTLQIEPSGRSASDIQVVDAWR